MSKLLLRRQVVPLICGLLVLAITCTALPTDMIDSSVNSEESAEKAHNNKTRDQIIYDTSNELSEIWEFYVNNSEKLLRPLADKLNELPEKSYYIVYIAKSIDDLLSLVDAWKILVDLDVYPYNSYYFIGEIIAEKLINYISLSEDEDTDVLNAAYKEVGIKDLDDAFNEKFDALIKRFSEAIKNYTTTLNDSERDSESKLLEFYDDFQREESRDEKMNKFKVIWEWLQNEMEQISN